MLCGAVDLLRPQESRRSTHVCWCVLGMYYLEDILAAGKIRKILVSFLSVEVLILSQIAFDILDFYTERDVHDSCWHWHSLMMRSGIRNQIICHSDV